jgi:hypothetical protein
MTDEFVYVPVGCSEREYEGVVSVEQQLEEEQEWWDKKTTRRYYSDTGSRTPGCQRLLNTNQNPMKPAGCVPYTMSD